MNRTLKRINDTVVKIVEKSCLLNQFGVCFFVHFFTLLFKCEKQFGVVLITTTEMRKLFSF